ncbi:MAG: histidine kinase [Blautia sp.]|nr:histidine kinase [Blautia sp.]
MKPLSAKITHRMFVIYISIYLVTLLLLILLVRPGLENEADRSAVNTLSLMTGELENVYSNLTEYGGTIRYNKDLSDLLKEYRAKPDKVCKARITQTLSDFVIANSSVLTASLEDMEHNYFHAIYYSNVCNASSAQEDPLYQNILEKQAGSCYRYLSPDLFIAQDLSLGHHAMELIQLIHLDHTPYVFRIYADLNTAIRHISLLDNNTFSDTAVLYGDGTAAYISGERFEEDKDNLSSLFPYTVSTGRLRTNAGVYFYQKDINTGWILLGFSPNRIYHRVLIHIFSIVTLLYLLSAVIYTLFLVLSIRHFLQPLGILNLAMQEYSAGNEVKTEIHTQDEIETLNDYFLEMTQKINEQVDDIREQEHVNSVTNYKLLATQIDPHFIYNAMNIINIMAREGNTTAVQEINSALIKILRERLNTKLTITDTVENERDTLYQYSRIMAYRYENKIRLSMDVDSELLDCQIPKNILQPLAENSFYHGFPSLADGQEGHIDIVIYSIEDELVIEISDDGAGIAPERLEILRNRSYEIYNDKKPHIGLDNIRQRLAFMYHDQYQFEIQSTQGYGTTISITIPLIR